MNEISEQLIEPSMSTEKGDTSRIKSRQNDPAAQAQPSAPQRSIELLFCLALFAFVVLSRAFTSGPVYFADGPLHLKAIADGSYVIQPPGYWLFNRMASFFPDPEHGILILNWLVSAAGAVVFYLAARRLLEPYIAKLVAVLYAVVFFAWFSGNVHSTYASQLLFPVLTLYLMLRATERPGNLLACAAGLSYAMGAGLRPSDGIFVGPMFLYFAVQRLPRRQMILCLATAFIACLAWLIPSQIAMSHYPLTIWNQLSGVAIGAIFLGCFNIYTVSNTVRVFLPLSIALGPLLPFAFLAKSDARLPLRIAILPGLAFFLFIYISDAPYLDYLLGPMLLLGALGASDRLSRLQATLAICAAILLNVSTYTLFHPLTLPGKASLVAQIIDKDAGMYTRYAIRHRLMMRLSNQ